MEIDFDEEDIKEKGINQFFEYCYGLGEIAYSNKRKYIYLLAANNKSISSFSFEILSLITGMSVNKSENLYNIFKECTPDTS